MSGGSSTSPLGVVRLTQRLGDAKWYATRVTGVPLTRLPTEVDEDTVYMTSVSRRYSYDECI